MALVLSPSSSTIADMFSAPDWSKMALVSGEILGCPLAMVNETAAINTVDIPSAVRGVERKTKYERAEMLCRLMLCLLQALCMDF